MLILGISVRNINGKRPGGPTRYIYKTKDTIVDFRVGLGVEFSMFQILSAGTVFHFYPVISTKISDQSITNNLQFYLNYYPFGAFDKFYVDADFCFLFILIRGVRSHYILLIPCIPCK
jgi:hypothetical protein